MTDLTYDQIAQFAYDLSKNDEYNKRVSIGLRASISLMTTDYIRHMTNARSHLESIKSDIDTILRDMGRRKVGDTNQNMTRFIAKAHTDMAVAEGYGDMLLAMLENVGYTVEDIAAAS